MRMLDIIPIVISYEAGTQLVMTACLLDAVAAKITQKCYIQAKIVPSRSTMSSTAYPIWAGNLPQITWT